MIDEAFISKQCCQKQTNDCKPKCQIKNEIKLLKTPILGFVSQLCSPFAMATSILCKNSFICQFCISALNVKNSAEIFEKA